MAFLVSEINDREYGDMIIRDFAHITSHAASELDFLRLQKPIGTTNLDLVIRMLEVFTRDRYTPHEPTGGFYLEGLIFGHALENMGEIKRAENPLFTDLHDHLVLWRERLIHLKRFPERHHDDDFRSAVTFCIKLSNQMVAEA